MTWKCWVILIVIAAVATGVVVWQNREVARLEALQEHLMVERRKAMSIATSARRDAEQHEAAAIGFRSERDELQVLLDAAMVPAIPAPRTIDEYRVHSSKLRQRMALLDQSLVLCDAEALSCGMALAAVKVERDQYRRVTEIDTDRFKLLYKQRRKEKRNKILIGVGAALAAGLVGYGIGASVR